MRVAELGPCEPACPEGSHSPEARMRGRSNRAISNTMGRVEIRKEGAGSRRDGIRHHLSREGLARGADHQDLIPGDPVFVSAISQYAPLIIEVDKLSPGGPVAVEAGGARGRSGVGLVEIQGV